jgi:protein-S-isoprenylcysteine O-methyltransferase Ste14
VARYLGALTIILLPGLVWTRIYLLRGQGIKALRFGEIDKSDFLILPFVLLYFYVIFAGAFDWPNVSGREFFHSAALAWIGVLLCLLGLLLMVWSLISFGRSFRVGIDADRPDRLVTDGVFALSRNPIYVAFATILVGEFLIFPNWLTLIYLGAASWLFHRQVLREEAFLHQHYGQSYSDYCRRVRRYL